MLAIADRAVIDVTMPGRAIANVLTRAFEGERTHAWLMGCVLETQMPRRTPWYWDASLFDCADFTLWLDVRLHPWRNLSEVRKFTRRIMLQALAEIRADHPRLWGVLRAAEHAQDNCDIDEKDADAIVQLLFLGAIVFEDTT